MLAINLSMVPHANIDSRFAVVQEMESLVDLNGGIT